MFNGGVAAGEASGLACGGASAGTSGAGVAVLGGDGGVSVGGGVAGTSVVASASSVAGAMAKLARFAAVQLLRSGAWAFSGLEKAAKAITLKFARNFMISGRIHKFLNFDDGARHNKVHALLAKCG